MAVLFITKDGLDLRPHYLQKTEGNDGAVSLCIAVKENCYDIQIFILKEMRFFDGDEEM